MSVQTGFPRDEDRRSSVGVLVICVQWTEVYAVLPGVTVRH